MKLVNAKRADGTAYGAYRTWAVLDDAGKRIGTIQSVRTTWGILRERDDGRRHAWRGENADPTEHLGIFPDEGAAIEAIASGLARPRPGKFEP